jgi:glycosyltransferase involved in cell wall biosynthesis
MSAANIGFDMSQQLRILMLSQFYPPIIGGEERHVRSLGSGLAARGHQVIVATQVHGGHAAIEAELGMEIHRLSGTLQRSSSLFSEPGRRHMPPFPDPEFMLGLRRLVREFQPDVVHAHNWVVHSFAPLKGMSKAPLILTLHDYGFCCAKKNLMYKGMPCTGPGLRKCLPCAAEHYGVAKGTVTAAANWLMTALSPVDKYLTVSAAVAELNQLQKQPTPYEVVPNFIPDDLGAISDQNDEYLKQLPTEPFMLFVGDLRRQKGLHVVLEAYEKLTHRPPLVLIGRPCPDTPKLLPDGVRILTNWPHAAVMQAWQRAMLGLAPSIWPEPCATVVLEGMVCGKPVIATDMGGNRDMVAHEQTGLLVPAQDSSALAMAMQRLIDDPELRQRMGISAQGKVKTFQASTVIPRIESIYRSLICQKRVGAGTETKPKSSDNGVRPLREDSHS